VLLKDTFQIGWRYGLERSSALFKCRTGDSASDSAILAASIKSDGLGEARPKEIKFEFNWTFKEVTPSIRGPSETNVGYPVRVHRQGNLSGGWALVKRPPPDRDTIAGTCGGNMR
jgi:hypothetical protein